MTGADFSNIALFQIHKAVGDLTQCELVRGDKVFANTNADHQRAAFAGTNQLVGLISVNHRQTVGTLQLGHGQFDRTQQIALLLVVVMH